MNHENRDLTPQQVGMVVVHVRVIEWDVVFYAYLVASKKHYLDSYLDG